MKITCPDCSTSYEVSAKALGPKGRSVKCARCGTRWHAGGDDATDTISIETDLPAEAEATARPAQAQAQTQAQTRAMAMAGADAPPEDEAALDDAWASALAEDDTQESADAGAGAEATTGSDKAGETGETGDLDVFDMNDAPRDGGSDDAFDDPLADFDVDALADAAGPPAEAAPQPIDIETLAKKPKIQIRTKAPEPVLKRVAGAVARRARQVKPRRVVGALVFFAAIGSCALAIALRNPIVERMPDLAGLFALAGMEVNLRGLEFRDLRTFRELDNGTIVLVVEGAIENVNPQSTAVPALRFALRSEDAQEIYAWVVEPRLRWLDVGGSTRFRTRLSSPPDLAADIQVRFVERDRQQARL
ncbi:zinc-ribbon domain-containing protein [Stappia sp.]|uniref:zinc-ribbon domain-containing protein n=1 Tax=Stappia sp. TaxID=1870903 RepID=UPI0032D9307C